MDDETKTKIGFEPYEVGGEGRFFARGHFDAAEFAAQLSAEEYDEPGYVLPEEVGHGWWREITGTDEDGEECEVFVKADTNAEGAFPVTFEIF